MKELIKLLEPILRYLDIPVDLLLSDEVSLLLKICLFYFIACCFILLNVINICIYLLSIYILSNERILSKIPSKYGFIHKLLKYYKNIRIFFYFN